MVRALIAMMALAVLSASAAWAAGGDGAGATAHGIVRASEQATLSSEMAGRVVRLPFAPGAAFTKGEVLAEFACDMVRAEVEAARAAERGAQVKLAHLRRLDKLASAGGLDLALAEAGAVEGAARVKVATTREGFCQLRAPFDGLVLARLIEPQESVELMKPLLRIARRGPLEVDVIAPVAWLPWLKADAPLVFTTADGKSVEGRVLRIGASVDPASQTLEMRGLLRIEAGQGLLPGTGGAVSFRPAGAS
ncbi:MAG: HlyD family efflux transporter periplasmic adaptor subunit [Alphaproteobacteria bacterium]|nr:HlyD family efflux transporter periplasmic adaptor subunit [Alphaproteobacteria bacterium]